MTDWTTTLEQYLFDFGVVTVVKLGEEVFGESGIHDRRILIETGQHTKPEED